ncbi:unnamed protein product [Tetraodon nigroviridis]|uniref:(spotted green pufferfish) hypothetical protein n=1 Tax=Tetraodon nigroviridis TaxID=99883 RepID=Q4SMF6_TETNG|nr:unnamed protein product [Tetraodon nigroviridis]
MAGRGWADWFEREEFIGQISDMGVERLQGGRGGRVWGGIGKWGGGGWVKLGGGEGK